MIENYDLRGFYKRIREERLRRNLTQEKVSLDINYSPNYITLLENGHRKLSVNGLIALSKYFNVSADYLLSGYCKIPAEKPSEQTAASIYSNKKI